MTDTTIDAPMRDEVMQIETIEQLLSRTNTTKIVAIEPQDRREFARALVLQGYDAPRAHRMAYDDCGEIHDNDGALQMLARHRLAHTARPEAGEDAELSRLRAALAEIAAEVWVPLLELPNYDQPKAWRKIAVERIEIARAALAVPA